MNSLSAIAMPSISKSKEAVYESKESKRLSIADENNKCSVEHRTQKCFDHAKQIEAVKYTAKNYKAIEQRVILFIKPLLSLYQSAVAAQNLGLSVEVASTETIAMNHNLDVGYSHNSPILRPKTPTPESQQQYQLNGFPCEG
jgi:hypothetical protein